jgi:hypothetical protein
LLEQLGTPYTNALVARLHRFAYVPNKVLETLAGWALDETWGNDLFVLEKYLAVHVPWSIEQGRFTANGDQLYFAAGSLQTRYGVPIYLVFERNWNEDRQPWALIHTGTNISAPELPPPPEIPAPPEIPVGSEVVVSHEHILKDNSDRVQFLAGTPPVAQICAVTGAIQWSLNRRLQLPYWYFGRMQYLVPLYLQSREDITAAPDLVAPLQVTEDRLMVRTALPPVAPYANARVAVRRHDQLPAWLLAGWKAVAAMATQEQIEDPEAGQ